jgi:hypothetical protein
MQDMEFSNSISTFSFTLFEKRSVQEFAERMSQQKYDRRYAIESVCDLRRALECSLTTQIHRRSGATHGRTDARNK